MLKAAVHIVTSMLYKGNAWILSHSHARCSRKVYSAFSLHGFCYFPRSANFVLIDIRIANIASHSCGRCEGREQNFKCDSCGMAETPTVVLFPSLFIDDV